MSHPDNVRPMTPEGNPNPGGGRGNGSRGLTHHRLNELERRKAVHKASERKSVQGRGRR